MYDKPFQLYDPFSFPPFPSLDLINPLDLPFYDLDLPENLPIPSPLLPFPNFTPQSHSQTHLAITSLADRVAALELSLGLRSPKFDTKLSWTAEYSGPRELGLDRKYKWVSESKKSGERTAKLIAEIRGEKDDVDRKYKWVAAKKGNGAGDVKWSAEYKGNGKWAPVSRRFTWQSSTFGEDEDEEEEEVLVKRNDKKKKSEKGKCVKLVEVEEKTPSRATLAMRKAFAKSNRKGKKKEMSPQDAALLIQMSYRAHLVRRAQVLRCLRSLAVAKAKLKELRTLFCNFHYRSRIAKDAEERQRFSEKIIVLLLTVDGIEGPDYLVRVAKKSMIEELEAMLEVVDPQPAGKLVSMRRRKFDLPEGPVSKEMMAGVAEVVQMLAEE